MSLPKVIFNILSNDPAVAAIVASRIYPNKAPQGVTAPYVVFSRIAATPHDTATGPSGHDFNRVQIESYGNSYDEAFDLNETIRRAIDRKTTGQMNGCQYLTTLETYVWEVELHLVASDYQIMWQR